MPPLVQATQEVAQPPVLEKPSSHFFSWRVFVFLMIVVFIAAGVTSMYFFNKQQTPTQPGVPKAISISHTPAPTVMPSPTPISTTSQTKYLIIDGSLYKKDAGKNTLVVDKKSLKHNQIQIESIDEFTESPNQTKIALFAFGGTSAYFLFYIDLATNEIAFIDFAADAIWSPNSRYLAYTNRQADIGPERVFVYDLQKQNNAKTIQSKNTTTTSYKNLVWNKTSDTLTADFETFDDIPNGKIIDKGQTQISIK